MLASVGCTTSQRGLHYPPVTSRVGCTPREVAGTDARLLGGFCDTVYLFMSLEKSTPTQNCQLNVLMVIVNNECWEVVPRGGRAHAFGKTANRLQKLSDG